MNNNNIIYQLREQDGEKIQNGEWTSALKKPIILEDQDQIVLNKAIVDSRSLDSGDITLDVDYQFVIDYNYYLNNWNNDNKINNSGSAQSSVDMGNYILCQAHTTGGGSKDAEKITEIVWDSNDPPAPIYKTTMTYEYEDLNGNKQNVHVPFIYPSPSGSERPTFTTEGQGWSLICKQGTFKHLAGADSTIINGFKLTNEKITSNDIPAGKTLYEPYRKNVVVSLPAGSYNPNDFAERINAEITRIPTNASYPVSNLTGNDILASTGYEFYDAATIGLLDGGARWIRSYGGNSFRLNSRRLGSLEEMWFGTSQFTLEYDNDTEKFKFVSINMPFYDTNGNQSVQYKQVTGTSDYALLNKNSGILIASLRAEKKEANGQYTYVENWWDNVLGFDLASVCVKYTYREDALATGAVAHYPLADLQDSVNMTGGFTGVDVAVYKPDPSGNWYKVPNVFPATNVSQQNEIFAAKSFGKQSFNFGYYLISVEGVQTDLITEQDVKTTIQGVVSRYYEQNNYSYGSDADAIIYTHRGATLILNELKCRILNSDYVVPNGIGDDNTIFIQHRKARVALDNQKENPDRF
jgi:hypothetical protein